MPTKQELHQAGKELKALDEPIKQAITSLQTENRIYIIYKGGDLKIIEPDGTIVFIYSEEMDEIIEAIKK